MIAETRCPCGWPKPAFCITTKSGVMPQDDLLIAVICPVCKTAYSTSERTQDDVAKVLNLPRPS